MSIGLRKRLIHAYFIVVIFPISAVYLIAVFVLFMGTVHSQEERRKYELELAVGGLEMDLNKIENLAGSVLQNDYVAQFLRHSYDSDWELMYDYLGYMQYQLYSYINYNPHIFTLHLYSDNVRLNPGGFFSPLDSFPVSIKHAMQGRWKADGEGRFHYYLGKSNQLKMEYAAEIVTDEELLEGFFQQAGMQVMLVGKDGKLYGANQYENNPVSERGKRFKKLEVPIPSLRVTAVVYLDIWEMALEAVLPPLLAGLFLFVALSGFLRICLKFVNIFQESDILRKKAELDAYQSKIEPHFLYGTLESLRMLALRSGDVPVADGIFNLAKLLRYSLTSSDESTLRKELMQVERYLELQKIRLEDRLFWEIRVQDDKLLDQSCPPFLLQPVVENSIRHGIEKLRKGGKIEIAIKKELMAVVISVSDDGAGISEEKKRLINGLIENSTSDYNPLQGEDKGYALYNIGMRIRLFYGKESTLRIENRSTGGTVCRMWLVYMHDGGR